MSYYKDYAKRYIGMSDCARLILEGCDRWEAANQKIKLERLDFGEDGGYDAYVVDEDCEIPAHYKKQFAFYDFVNIIDDTGLQERLGGREITFYTAGNFGCLIQVKEPDYNTLSKINRFYIYD